MAMRDNKYKDGAPGVVLLEHKDFFPSLQKLLKHGGQNRKRYEKIAGIVLELAHEGLSALKKFPTTKHGETRIRSCIKFDLGGGFRLITQQAKKGIMLLFAGSHEACEKWLSRNTGLEIAVDREYGALLPMYKSTPEMGVVLSPPPKPSEIPILELFSASKTAELLDGVPLETVVRLNRLRGTVTTEKINEICSNITDNERRHLVQDVLKHLAADDAENAGLRLDEFFGRTRTLENSGDSEILEVKDGDTIRRLLIDSDEYENWFKRFALEGDHVEWMLFMHPEQKRIVDADFDGSSQLSGVSGSGKTCIAVQRALRLANLSEDENVLLVTLNRSLAGLISMLVDAAAEGTRLRSRVKVISFFELCQELLGEFEPHRTKYYDAVTDKLNEPIDEVFREYYRCWNNFRVAAVLIPIHQSLCAQKINAEAYLREEFDWIRTALPRIEREDYIDTKKTQRLGRTHPIGKEWRRAILKGLEGWEQKMEAVGVIDYLGLTTALSHYKDNLANRFTRIVVDEAQDFGTMELLMLRQMVPVGPNDIFLCGDIAQHILPKHRVLSQAGIKIGGRTRRIQRNYRNPRQILEAAFHVLCDNLHVEMLDRPEKDLEILDPKYAKRSSAKPLVLGTETLREELQYARSVVVAYLQQKPNANCCIAIAGYSMCEVEKFAITLGLRALDGSGGFLHDSLVLSDLEQTKGYEFDLVVIVNCCDGVLPRLGTPEDEIYRDGCRLYVAMTRAKNDLYLSYHGKPSPWLESAKDKLTFSDWDNLEVITPLYITQEPEKIREMADSHDGSIGALNGEEYCYTKYALGLSREAQEKLRKLVVGWGSDRNPRRVKLPSEGDLEKNIVSSPRVRMKWLTVADLKDDLVSSPGVQRIFGPKTSRDLIDNLTAALN